ncbi:MAG: hypothetical protein JWQ87_2583 [Candidatus Sulfotelmatobacter sp.]|nr:hypothetical protein [Candidatus Sulfotelmatobacter sp.]
MKEREKGRITVAQNAASVHRDEFGSARPVGNHQLLQVVILPNSDAQFCSSNIRRPGNNSFMSAATSRRNLGVSTN